MNILIIGGTGLISTSIARQLLQSGHDVTLFNRGQSENRLPDGAKEIRGDRREYSGFENTFANARYDVVCDMVSFSPDDAASALRAFRGKTAQFIQCSTVCVYSGAVSQYPTSETEPYHSIGDYGKNKAAIDRMFLQAFESENFPVTIMRPSHSYGEGGAVIRPFGPANSQIQRMRAGKPLIVHGDGNSAWGACHVDDVARGFIAAMGREKCLGEAYNVAASECLTWNQYYETIARVLAADFTPVYLPTETLRQVAPQWAQGTYEIFEWPSFFDSSKLQRDAGWSGQTISFEDGTRRNVQWVDENNKLADLSAADDAYEDALIAAWKNIAPSLPQQK